MGEDGLFVSAFDHGGAGGGYENTCTWQALFRAMKIKNIRIHNRPAYNSEVHATRDMGVGETQQLLRGCRTRRHYRCCWNQRARNPNQLLPESLGAKPARQFAGQERRPSLDQEPVERAKIIIVDPAEP
jgi:arsenite oxidase large subunit